MSYLSRKAILSLLYFLVLSVLPLAGSSLATYWVLTNERWITQFQWPQWLLLYVLTAFTMAFALTPTTLIALLSGYLLGWGAVLPLCISYLAASWLGYTAMSAWDGGYLLSFLAQRPRYQQFIERLQQGSLGVIVLSRLSPVLPFACMNAVFAVLKIQLRPFLWGSFLGMLPRTLLSIWAGTQARALYTLLQNPDTSLPWRLALIGLTGISISGIGYFVRKYGKS